MKGMQGAINRAPTNYAELVGAPFMAPLNVLQQIESHVLENPRVEVCGFIYKTHYVPLPNTASSPDRYYADPCVLAQTLAHYGEPEIIFHSHPNRNLELSQEDRRLWYYPDSTIMIGCMIEGRLRWKTYVKRSD
jgi:proteasome lid subunit RPN8/RPN11